MILQVIQQMIYEMLIGGRKIVNSDMCFSVTNIKTNAQNDYSEYEGLLQEMVAHKPFINQHIYQINLNGERSICTVSTYLK